MRAGEIQGLKGEVYQDVQLTTDAHWPYLKRSRRCFRLPNRLRAAGEDLRKAAMETGIADHVWSLEEVVALLD